MKRLFSKRWHRLPVALMAVILVLVLTAGSVFAAYSFQKVDVDVEVEEAIVLGLWDTWDNLVPYGSVDDVDITLGEVGGLPTVSITTIEGYAGAGFVAGEFIVTPVNFRNAGDGELTLGAILVGSGLDVDYCWQENAGNVGTITEESGQLLCRDFKATGVWAPLDEWSGVIVAKGGKSGSAVVGAQVLFVRFTAPDDIVPGTYTFGVEFTRG